MFRGTIDKTLKNNRLLVDFHPLVLANGEKKTRTMRSTFNKGRGEEL
jgi:hypothetical protein